MKTLFVITLVLLAGCTSKPTPDLERYLLRSDASNPFSASAPRAEIGLGSVQVAAYIDQPGIVVETADGSVTAARYNQWAEPLRQSLRKFLANEIAAAANQPVRASSYGETNWKRYTSKLIDVRIEQLHGTHAGEAILVAYWALIDPTERTVVSEHEFVAKEPLDSDGYPALVAAQKRLLTRLAADIASVL